MPVLPSSAPPSLVIQSALISTVADAIAPLLYQLALVTACMVPVSLNVMFAAPVVCTKVTLATSCQACSADCARNCSAVFSPLML